MDVLRTAVSMLSLYDPEAQDMSPEANQRKAVEADGADFHHRHHLRPPAQRQADASRATRALSFAGEFPLQPHRQAARRSDGARVRRRADAACRSRTERFHLRRARHRRDALRYLFRGHLGIGALKGPLHGGANRRSDQDAARSSATTDKAVERVQEHAGARRSRSPASAIASIAPKIRAPRTCACCREELGKRTGQENLYLHVEAHGRDREGREEAQSERDFYSASTYYSLGIPIDLFTPIFAVSRMSGWTAHVLEQYHNNRLIRPRAEYKGNPDGMPWIPMDER